MSTREATRYRPARSTAPRPILGKHTSDTDWGLEDGNPTPHGFWRGTHNRDGTGGVA